jgi:hypothetical protein
LPHGGATIFNAEPNTIFTRRCNTSGDG